MKGWSKLIAWFATDSGRKFSFGSSLAGTVGAFTLYVLPNTFLMENVKDLMQMYRKGEGVPVSDKVLARAQEMIEKLKIKEEHKPIIKFFTVCGFDPYFIGSTELIKGAFIGIPSSYNYETVNDVEKQLINVKGEPVNWESKPGKSLLNSFILNEDAQKFAIGTQLALAQSQHAYMNGITASVCVGAAYSFSSGINRRVNGFSRPLSFRLSMYCLVGCFVTGIWALFKDMTTSYLENSADREIAELGPELARGGVEFYTQVLNRNKALRELMGSDGENQFTASGNVEETIRRSHVPLTERRNNVRAILDSYKKQEPQQK